MATKAEILANPNSAFNRAADDEPIFVLRAWDIVAPDAVREWALDRNRMITRGVRPESERAEVDDAYEVAENMIAWRRKHRP